ncbi:CPBP family intramembrane glutamic endopeptidase [Planctobacterium marinum]|uniref:CAAX prenyl protease 2/Lysostaphin resistance protein A-like domain-containing protein n=1 Tax=Planctobacterium marinum TaxID=1631968 RepID=A0AA48KSY3_9ALTE|nr:hypothetical protein MACH26_03560 [Planctobacterium marinum]
MNSSSPFTRFANSPAGKVAALAEVLSVFFAGSIIASFLFQIAEVKGHPLMALLQDAPDLFAISWQLLKVLALQYVGWFVVVIIIGLLFQRRFIAGLGFTRNGQSLYWLVALGIIGWAVGDIPLKVLWLIDAQFNIGVSVPWREALIHSEKTAGWWTLMAVTSFGFVAIIEEVFWRGFVQARLQKSFSPLVAIVATAAMFTLSHAQYHQPDWYHLATIVSLFFSSLVFGWLFYKSGSIIPAIVMHSLLNFPADGVFTYLALGLMTCIAAWQFQVIKQQVNAVQQSFRAMSLHPMDGILVLFLAISMLSISQFPMLPLYLHYVTLPVLLVCWCWFLSCYKLRRDVKTTQ